MISNLIFSIITPTYNRAKFLDECLNSLSNQTFKNIEHIIVDGFSNDGTYEKVLEYKNNIKDYPVKIIQSKPHGVSDAFNVGIRNAKGKYIVFLNSDDYFDNKDALERVSKILINNPNIDWLQCDSCFNIKNVSIKVSNRFVLKPLFPLISTISCPLSHQACIMKREILENNGYFDDSINRDMDTDMYFKALFSGTHIYFTNLKFINFRFHRNSVTGRNNIFEMLFKIYPLFYNRYGIIPVVSTYNMYLKYKDRAKSIWVDGV